MYMYIVDYSEVGKNCLPFFHAIFPKIKCWKAKFLTHFVQLLLRNKNKSLPRVGNEPTIEYNQMQILNSIVAYDNNLISSKGPNQSNLPKELKHVTQVKHKLYTKCTRVLIQYI